MKVFYLILTLTIILTTSCSRRFKIAKVAPGYTDIDEAVHWLDDPELTTTSSINRGSQIHVWEDVTLQVNNNHIVTSVHRKPAGLEKSLQFWKHQYQEEASSFRQVNSNGTQKSLWQYDLPKKGTSVIYDEDLNEVTKVIIYEVN